MARRSEAASRDAALDEALELLHFGFRAIVADPDALLGRRGLGRVHHRVLYFVRTRTGLSIGDLVRTLGVTKQALHGPLSALVREGLVARSPDGENRRTVRLALTPAGAALERALSGAQRAHFARAFAEAGSTAERGFRAVLRALPRTRGETGAG